MQRQSDTTYVVNFWATWCKPCVEELPAFQQLWENGKGQKLRVILISMDAPKQKESRLMPFLKQKPFGPEVWLLGTGQAHTWIDKVSPEWSGSIPATLIFNTKANEKQFHEGTLSYEALERATRRASNKP
jgi:thiol-disulfide isomerase/thioredoxin